MRIVAHEGFLRCFNVLFLNLGPGYKNVLTL